MNVDSHVRSFESVLQMLIIGGCPLWEAKASRRFEMGYGVYSFSESTMPKRPFFQYNLFPSTQTDFWSNWIELHLEFWLCIDSNLQFNSTPPRLMCILNSFLSKYEDTDRRISYDIHPLIQLNSIWRKRQDYECTNSQNWSLNLIQNNSRI